MRQVFVVFCALVSIATTIEAVKQCPPYCNNYYDPVCTTNGSDYIRFDNICRMDMHNCELRSGERGYQVTNRKICDQRDYNLCQVQVRCSDIGPAVCGTDGYEQMTYTNLCQMRVFTCDKKRQWSVAGFRRCKSGKY